MELVRELAICRARTTTTDTRRTVSTARLDRTTVDRARHMVLRHTNLEERSSRAQTLNKTRSLSSDQRHSGVDTFGGSNDAHSDLLKPTDEPRAVPPIRARSTPHVLLTFGRSSRL